MSGWYDNEALYWEARSLMENNYGPYLSPRKRFALMRKDILDQVKSFLEENKEDMLKDVKGDVNGE